MRPAFFGLRSAAQPAETQLNTGDVTAYLASQLDSVRSELGERGRAIEALALSGAGIPHSSNALAGSRDALSWDRALATAEEDISRIQRLSRGNREVPDLDSVRGLLRTHVRELSGLVNLAPDATRVTQARALLNRIRIILGEREP